VQVLKAIYTYCLLLGSFFAAYFILLDLCFLAFQRRGSSRIFRRRPGRILGAFPRMRERAKTKLAEKADAAKSALGGDEVVEQDSWDLIYDALVRAWISSKARTLSVAFFLPSVLYCTLAAFVLVLPHSSLGQFAVAAIAAYTQMILVVLLDQVDTIAARRSFAIDFLYAAAVEALAATKAHSGAHSPDSTARLVASVERFGDCLLRYARHAFPAARGTVRRQLTLQAASSREALYARLNLVLTSREKIPELAGFLAASIKSVQQQEPLSLPRDASLTVFPAEPSESIWRLILGHLISLVAGAGILFGIQISGMKPEYAAILAPILLALVAAPNIWLRKRNSEAVQAEERREDQSLPGVDPVQPPSIIE